METSKKINEHRADGVELRQNSSRKGDTISAVKPSCEDRPGNIKHGYGNGPECEPIAIIGMGLRSKTCILIRGADISHSLPLAGRCLLTVETLGSPYGMSFRVL